MVKEVRGTDARRVVCTDSRSEGGFTERQRQGQAPHAAGLNTWDRHLEDVADMMTYVVRQRGPSRAMHQMGCESTTKRSNCDVSFIGYLRPLGHTVGARDPAMLFWDVLLARAVWSAHSLGMTAGMRVHVLGAGVTV